ncbi:SWIM zinc finger family protein [Streptomyces sp. NPDC046985]|uniref:SWIM zinc finger family protein n=1 Tax=Streptomyces sp. NPDC046985 TaxID=3155377 RepID=UPI0033C0E6DD
MRAALARRDAEAEHAAPARGSASAPEEEDPPRSGRVPPAEESARADDVPTQPGESTQRESSVRGEEVARPESSVYTEGSGQPGSSSVWSGESGRPESPIRSEESGRPETSVRAGETARPESSVYAEEPGRPQTSVRSEESTRPESSVRAEGTTRPVPSVWAGEAAQPVTSASDQADAPQRTPSSAQPASRSTTGGARRRSPASGAVPGVASGAAAGASVRAVRALLADAFRMPVTATADPHPEEGAHPEDEPDGGPHQTPPTPRTSATRPDSTPPRTPPDPPTPPASAAPPTPHASTLHASAAPPTPRMPPDPSTLHASTEPTTPSAVPTESAPMESAPMESAPTESAPRTPAPPAPLAPATMASPRRDGALRRTFPAFPARTGGASDFADTWWGRAWLTALEQGALDAARLARGRRYAERGHVDAITVTPGLVLAYVQGSRARPYRVQVRLRTLDDADWSRFLDAAAERPGHIAALLDKEMPHSLTECGVPLLPEPGDLAPQCSCPDSGHPCKHAAALCYQTARLLDADPFVLLLLRGRGERELLDALSRLNATRAARAARERAPAALPGIRATDVLARRDRRPPPPAPLPPPPHPEQPPVYPAAPGGPDPFALDQLATDAAARAHALLTTGRDPVGGLTLWQDAVRLAAARPGSGLTAATRALYAQLASAAGRTPSELARAVAAWRQGGLEGLAVLDEPWDPPAGRFDRARPLLLAADLPAFRPGRNRLTHPRGHVQLRLGRDGLWYAYESEPGREDWWPRGAPDLDPVGALTGLAMPDDL